MGSSGAYYPLLFHFQIPKSLKNEQLCWVGNIFIQINNNWQRLYSDKKKCFILKDYFEPTEQQIGIFGFVSMMIFLAILTVGFIYEWKKGALDWE